MGVCIIYHRSDWANVLKGKSTLDHYIYKYTLGCLCSQEIKQKVIVKFLQERYAADLQHMRDEGIPAEEIPSPNTDGSLDKIRYEAQAKWLQLNAAAITPPTPERP